MQPNWQQQGYGFQQPFQQQQLTGQFTGKPTFLSSQPTGFPAQTQQSMPTGRPSGNLSFLNAPPPSNAYGGGGGIHPQMTGYAGGGASGLFPQATGFPGGGLMSQPTGFGGGLMSQPTGMGLRAQPTGYQDPRLQSMFQSFMPSNLSQPFAPSGVPQFNQAPPQPLTQTFQTLLQNPSVKTPKVPWTLSKQEKKDYDQIFRAWEGGDGFISGETAREVFGQSGLRQDDLLKIWTLSDVDNRGKLNLPEFHVAMGLIYRALNGNDIPDTLPEELVPASMRDIDTTVNFMRDLLKHESTSRSNTSSPGYTTPAAKSRDASAYKYDESSAGKTYKPSSRHLDRKAVRYDGEDSNADISDIRRQLQNTSAMLDKSSAEAVAKSEEDERLEQEVEDLKYRVRRLKEDIDYVSKGRRTAEKDEERRKLERELLFLLHEKLPQLERRQQQREDEKRMEERAGIRSRDRRNQTHGRYDDRDQDSDDHYWLRGSYDRRDDRDRDRRDSYDRNYRHDDRGHERDRDYRDRDRDRSRDRYERPRSPAAAARSPPPAPPPVAATDSVANPPPAPPKPSKTPEVHSTKHMTPEERSAFIREQAQRRIQERLKALGVESAPETPAVDKSVEERLAQEKKEAEERSKTADAEQKAREEARQARLHGTSTPSSEPPKSPEPSKGILKKGPPAPPALRGKAAPPPPASRGVSAKTAPVPPAPPTSTTAQPTPPEDPEEAEFRRREEAILKAKEERRKRLEQLEKEEEEERRREEESRAARSVKSPAVEAPVQSPPPAPPAPPAPTPPVAPGGNYNPFRKPGAAAGASIGAAGTVAAGAAASKSGFNPFFKPNASKDPSSASTPASEPITSPAVESVPTSVPPAPAPPPAPPAPPAPAPPPAVNKVSAPADDDWESIHEKEADSDDSSDDDDYATSRDNRRNLASALFGGSTSAPSSRPGSAKPEPPAALKNLGGGDPNAGRGALLSAIKGGARLKSAQTVVKGEPVSGRVVGDTAPPAHINPTAQEQEPTPEPESFDAGPSNRNSVDWYAGLAADEHPAASAAETSVLEPTREEPEIETPAIAVQDSAETEDPLADVDVTKSIRVRTLFPYEGQRDVDLTFKENVVIVAHPAKDASSPWWYGMQVDGGSKGWFPSDYVEELQHVQARALYSYAGGSDEELPFAEGDELVIVDQSDPDWWKTEKSGVIFIVPAAYFEVIGAYASTTTDAPRPQPQSLATGSVPSHVPTSAAPPSNMPSLQPLTAASSLLSPESATLIPPTAPTRRRSSTLFSLASTINSGDESSDDSVLSWWTGEDSDAEPDMDREAERKRREGERQKILTAAGLKLSREPPKPPTDHHSRRPAPAAPKRRRKAPAIPLNLGSSHEEVSLPQEASRPLETQDAYARYEQFLAESRDRPPKPSPSPRPVHQEPPSPAPSQASQQPHGSRLSGFFSKIVGNTLEPRKPGPLISGPITRVDTPAIELPSESDIGKTWGSLVDPGVLTSMSDRERKRQEAIFEFISTEGSYNRDLQLIVQVFYAGLLDVLDEKAQTVIFANIEDILLANTSFLSALEQRQKSCRLYIDRIGDILEDCMPSMDVYTTYCVNKAQAAQLLQHLRSSDARIQAHLETIRENPEVRGLDLSHFLLIPMQRITRYPLLIRQIIHYTEPDQDLAEDEKALGIVEQIVTTINEDVRQAEDQERLRVLSEHLWIGGEGRLDLTAPTAYQGPRRLIREGPVSKSKSGRKLTLVLCNDILVLIDTGDLYRMPIALFECTVRPTRDEAGFNLKVEQRRGGDSIGLRASSARDAKEWVLAIESARIRAIDAKASGGTGGMGRY